MRQQRMPPSLRAHSEAEGEAIQKQQLDCFGPADLAMTRALINFGETRWFHSAATMRLPVSLRASTGAKNFAV
jgi:hypothetical protein